MMNRHSQFIATMLLLAAVLSAGAGLVGCGPSNTGAAPWQNLPPEPATAVNDAEFFHYLITGVASVAQNDAYRAILIWIDGKDESRHFGQRIETLQSRGLLSPGWAHNPVEPLTRGRLASIVCRRYTIRSSVALLLTGPNERAARRELEYRRIMIPGGDGPMSGAEFVNVLKRADEMLGSPDDAVAEPG